MQGRLSPPPRGHLQSFPWGSWQEEFQSARDCGFDTIEWLFESDSYEKNPIWTGEGVDRIKQLESASGVKVRSLCADYFMAHPFFRVREKEKRQSTSVLKKLILQGAEVGIQVILIPVLEVSEVRTEDEKTQLLESLRTPLQLAAASGIKLGLETELPALEYRELIERGNHPSLGAYYDVGNAAARGYDSAADIELLSRLLCGVHIKDRRLDGPSVLLGQGDVPFSNLFSKLVEITYPGPLVLQTAFGDDYLGAAKAHLNFVKQHIDPASVRTEQRIRR